MRINEFFTRLSVKCKDQEKEIQQLKQQLAKLKEENEKLRGYLDEILTYAQYPSSKIANEALGE